MHRQSHAPAGGMPPDRDSLTAIQLAGCQARSHRSLSGTALSTTYSVCDFCDDSDRHTHFTDDQKSCVMNCISFRSIPAPGGRVAPLVAAPSRVLDLGTSAFTSAGR